MDFQPHVPYRRTLFPKSRQDVLEILDQARRNDTSVVTTGGSCQSYFPGTSDDAVSMDLRYLNKFIELNSLEKTAKVESGMRLSSLVKLLEPMSMSLRIPGQLPDISFCDAIAVGLIGSSRNFFSCIVNAEVVLANGTCQTWTWDQHPDQMRSLCCGLGVVAVVVSVTVRFSPMTRFAQRSSLCLTQDVIHRWDTLCKSSTWQQLHWLPQSQMVIFTSYIMTSSVKSDMLNQVGFESLKSADGSLIESACLSTLWLLRLLRSSLWRYLPSVVSFLGRVQFFIQWSLERKRSSERSSPACVFSTASQLFAGATAWTLPFRNLPQVLSEVSSWARRNPNGCPYAPLCIQVSADDLDSVTSVVGDCTPDRHRKNSRPFLLPTPVAGYGKDDGRVCTLWSDWFSGHDSNFVAKAEFEDIILSHGGSKFLAPGDLTSPLALKYQHGVRYRKWVDIKRKTDKKFMLLSGYVRRPI